MNRRGFLASALVALALDWRASRPAVWDVVATMTSPTPVHPDPRPGITAARVLDTDAVRRKPRIAEIYDMAREIPQIFDGLYCYCHCQDGAMAHRSLLSCFESEQAVGCYGCGAVARVAHKAYKKGKSLAEIREACDKAFG
jgi:hypothetical protein